MLRSITTRRKRFGQQSAYIEKIYQNWGRFRHQSVVNREERLFASCQIRRLSIHETTAINQHTNLFAKKVEKVGLVVIDDPLSIPGFGSDETETAVRYTSMSNRKSHIHGEADVITCETREIFPREQSSGQSST